MNPSRSEHMELEVLMTTVRDGDQVGWDIEFEDLREHHAPKIRALTLNVLQNGIREPLLIGDDGRLWDGHHRLYVAHAMGFTHVPVKYAREMRR